MSRRKHVALNMLQQEVEPPGEGEYIVRAVGSRGSNIMEVRQAAHHPLVRFLVPFPAISLRGVSGLNNPANTAMAILLLA